MVGLLLAVRTIAEGLATNLAPVDDVINALGFRLGELVGSSAVDFLGGALEYAVSAAAARFPTAHGDEEEKTDEHEKNDQFSTFESGSFA